MKILHVTPYFYGAWAYGGIPRLSYHLAAAQAALGHTVHVATTDAQDAASRRPGGDYAISDLAVRVYPNRSNWAAYHYQFFWPRGIGAEKKFIRQYDVVHVHGHRNLHNHALAKIAAGAKVPIVLQPNGTLVNIERRQTMKAAYDSLFGRRQLERTTALVAVAKAERDQFVKLGMAESVIRVIPNGVDMDSDPQGQSFKTNFNIKGDYLLYLGKITPRKGIEHAIYALSRIEDKNLSLAVAGNDMGFLRILQLFAKKLDLTKRVFFTGLVTGPMKAAAYREALYTVYTGRDEIFGLVPWESILCGTPAIVADDSGCGQWIREADAGYVVPYADPAAIAAIVNQRDRERERLMLERGLEFCKDRLSWRRIAAEMVEWYREIAR